MTSKSFASCIGVIALLVASFIPQAFAHEFLGEPVHPQIKKVTILMLNDVYQGQPVDHGSAGGLARVATLKKEILTKQPELLFLFAGDTISPSVASRTFRGKQMIEGWNAVGIDYATLGNHEFDFGPDVLLERIADSKFKWLCANVVDKSSGAPFANLKPYEIRQVNGIKVGVIGLLSQDTLRSSKVGPKLDILDPCMVAKKLVPEMRARGAEVIVALTHLSISDDKALTHCVPIDVVVGGHEHVVLQAVSAGTPILKAGSDARHLGRIDVNYQTADKKVQSIDWQLIPVTDKIKDDPEVAAVIQEYDSKLSTELDRPIAETKTEWDALQATNESRETNLGNLIADAYREETGADVAMFNGGSIRSNQTYGPGKLTKRDILSLLPFENPVVKIEVRGAVIQQALEHGVATVGIKADGRFPQVSGMTVEYDASKPVGTRVSKILINGKPLVADSKYTLATNGYVITGGDGYDMFKSAHFLLKPEEGNSEAVSLVNFISKAKQISPQIEQRVVRLDRAP